ncbi:hypothetical protein G6F22_018345 [Rhizopus arrhizus]|nr:hypothetical protein G6F22_018345 [Rhizopus arrhizus]
MVLPGLTRAANQGQERYDEARTARHEHLRQHRPRRKCRRHRKHRPAEAGGRRVRAPADHRGHAAEQPHGGHGGHHVVQHPGRITHTGSVAGQPGGSQRKHAGKQQHGDADRDQGGRGLRQRQPQPLPIGARGSQGEQGDEPPGIGADHRGGQNGQQNDGGNDTLAQHMTVSSWAAWERRAGRRLLIARRFR